MDAENAELLATFEGLVKSMSNNAEMIRKLAERDGIPIENFATVLNSINTQIEIARRNAEFIRSGGLD